jgi:hypothetical protein
MSSSELNFQKCCPLQNLIGFGDRRASVAHLHWVVGEKKNSSIQPTHTHPYVFGFHGYVQRKIGSVLPLNGIKKEVNQIIL